MAFIFDGIDDYLEVLSTPVVGAPMTLFAWTNNTGDTGGATGGTHIAISVGDRNAEDRNAIFLYNFTTGTDAATAFSRQSSGGVNQRSELTISALTLNTWKPLTGVFASTSSRRVYYDGLIGNNQTTTVAPANVDSIMIGARFGTSVGAFFKGRLAECAIWDVALTSIEIIALESGIIPLKIRPSALKFYAPLIDNTNDIVGGRIMTAQGGSRKSIYHPRIYR